MQLVKLAEDLTKQPCLVLFVLLLLLFVEDLNHSFESANLSDCGLLARLVLGTTPEAKE